MAKKATNDELLAQFDDLDAPPAAPAVKSRPNTTGPAAAADDALADIEKDLAHRSRPHTPRVGTTSPRKSADVARTSVESTRGRGDVLSASFPAAKIEGMPASDPSREPAPAPAAASGSSWWGALSGAASAAVKQAEALAKEIQRNEDAQRWAEQVRGNMGVLATYGGELRSKALPTFTNLIHTLAPPISAHERLQIHIAHSLTGYPSLDPLIYQTFARVMAQVEGGELLIVQRGQEAAPRRGSEIGVSEAGWNDGPWWKQTSTKRDLAAVAGLVEGTKLARASAEAHAHEFFAARGGIDAAAEKAASPLDESNPTRTSDIFLAIQAIVYTPAVDLFGDTQAGETEPGVVEESIAFAIYLHDPLHNIKFAGVSQNLPSKWNSWLENLTEMPDGHLPGDIRSIVDSGGLDPREWVAEWVEETLALGVGIVAQKYVARRMGVGAEGFSKGKPREGPVDAGAGELARAM